MSFTEMLSMSLTPLLWVAMASVAACLCFLPSLRFRKAGVKHLTPVPLLGDIARGLFKSQHMLVNFDRIYNSFPGERFVGMSESVRPVVIVRDLELAKRVTVKDFDHFQNHSTVVNEEADPVFGRMVFSIQGQERREMRSLLGRFFTSLNLRRMVSPMVEVGDRVVAEIRTRIQESNASSWDADVDELSSRASFDIIVFCILGLKLNSRDNSDVYDKYGNFLQLKTSQIVRFLGFQVFPNLMKVVGVNLFSKSTTEFFNSLFIHALRTRKDDDIEGHDFIGFVLQTRKDVHHNNEKAASEDESTYGKKTVKKTWSDNDWYAQALALLVAGFDPVAAALGLLVHELALNPEVQERLALEVLEADGRNGGKIDYTSIQELTYMDMVVSELLRMWATSVVDRTCTKDYNLGRPNDSAPQDYIIRKGEGLYVPVRAIHYDPQYFPEPAKFDPERFSAENRHKIPPFAYNPFGVGPRMCLGPRFAICVIKVLVYQLLRDVRVSRCERTGASIRLDPSSLAMRNKGGSWVRLTLRK